MTSLAEASPEVHCLVEGGDRIPRRLTAGHGLDLGRQGEIVHYDVAQSAIYKKVTKM